MTYLRSPSPPQLLQSTWSYWGMWPKKPQNAMSDTKWWTNVEFSTEIWGGGVHRHQRNNLIEAGNDTLSYPVEDHETCIKTNAFMVDSAGMSTNVIFLFIQHNIHPSQSQSACSYKTGHTHSNHSNSHFEFSAPSTMQWVLLCEGGNCSSQKKILVWDQTSSQS